MMMRNSKASDLQYRLGSYLMTVGGLGLASGAANAAVTPINVTHTITANIQSEAYDIDFDGGGVDFQFWVSDGIESDINVQNQNQYQTQFHIMQRGGCTESSYYAGNVAPGTTIGASLFANPSPQTFSVIWASERIADCNNFISGQWGILAFRKEVSAGNYRYGYLNIRQRLGSNILDINGGAYESNLNGPISTAPTAPVSIPVGAAVPVGISLLVAGAAALRLRGKRKAN